MRSIGVCLFCGGAVVFESDHGGGARRCLGCDARGIDVVIGTDAAAGPKYEAPDDVPTLVELPVSDEPTLVTADPTAPWRAALADAARADF